MQTHKKPPKKKKILVYLLFHIFGKRWEGKREWEKRLGLKDSSVGSKKRNDEPKNRFLARISSSDEFLNNSHSWIECKFILSFISLPSFFGFFFTSHKVEMGFFFLVLGEKEQQNRRLRNTEKKCKKRRKKKFLQLFSRWHRQRRFFALFAFSLSCLLPFLLRITSEQKNFNKKFIPASFSFALRIEKNVFVLGKFVSRIFFPVKNSESSC